MEELLLKVFASILSIGAILLVLYFINKQAMKKAKRMEKEFEEMEKQQEIIKKENAEQEKKEKIKKENQKKNFKKKNTR